MRIGFVSDEISADISEAFRIGLSWDVHDYELRVVGDRRVPHIVRDQVRHIQTLQRSHGLRITALSPGLFKGTLADRKRLQQECRDALPRTFDLAGELGVSLVIVFGLRRGRDDRQEDGARVADHFRAVAAAAAARGLRVAIENEPGFWCDSGSNTARLLARVDDAALAANWDPCNAVGGREAPFPEGYRSLKPWIANVHVKDTIEGALVGCVALGEGVVDWPGQLRALAADRIVEHVTIETHCLPLVDKSRQNLETVRGILEQLQ